MHASRPPAVCSLLFALIAACSSKSGGTFQTYGDPAGQPLGSDAGSDPGSATLATVGDGSSPVLVLGNEGGFSNSSTESMCKGGHYLGSFDGSYESSYVIGLPLKVTGNVDLTLNAYGSPMQTCTFMGETDSCSNFYQLSGGTVTGVANETMIGEAGVGGYPYFCFLTGTLDCKAKKLVGGWIECVYCVAGVIDDGGMTCDPTVAGVGTGVYGNFAGPVTADYDYGTFSFVNGTWNGAEALAHNNGNMPGPEGGSVTSYLALDGGYGFGSYGGAGTWNATYR
jgi:hypothetical protein